jgi:hypothetical protein
MFCVRINSQADEEVEDIDSSDSDDHGGAVAERIAEPSALRRRLTIARLTPSQTVHVGLGTVGFLPSPHSVLHCLSGPSFFWRSDDSASRCRSSVTGSGSAAGCICVRAVAWRRCRCVVGSGGTDRTARTEPTQPSARKRPRRACAWCAPPLAFLITTRCRLPLCVCIFVMFSAFLTRSSSHEVSRCCW